MNEQRYLLVVSGPSGIGKDTVVRCLMERHAGIELSVSATTRAPRPGEKQGELYYYMSREEFEQRIADDAFVEYTIYAGNYYGTLKSEVEKRIANGVVCVLVIEVTGAGNVKRLYPACTTVFVEAPDMEEHARRLRGRGSEDEAAMAERMRIAEKEMTYAGQYDYRLVNDVAADCAERLYGILQERLSG